MPAKYHITKKGEPGVCHAAYNCPLGGESEHYATKEAAAEAYEVKMMQELIPTLKGKKEIPTAALTKLAKISSDPQVLKQVVEHGSNTSLKSLAHNAHVPAKLLLEAHGKGDDATKLALATNPNFPVEEMTDLEFVYAYSKADPGRQVALMQSDAVTDTHLQALEGVEGKHRPNLLAVSHAYNNPHNKLSDKYVVEVAERSANIKSALIRSGRYPASAIPRMEKAYWGDIYRNTNPEYLDAYADWATARRVEGNTDPMQEAEYIAGQVAGNEHTTPETLHKLAQKGMALDIIYKNPKAGRETKALAVKGSPRAQRLQKLEEAERQVGGNLREALTVSNVTNAPFGRNRGYKTTEIQLDAEKVKRLGLTKEDVYTLMGADRGGFNAGASYDEATGVFKGAVDSTD